MALILEENRQGMPDIADLQYDTAIDNMSKLYQTIELVQM